MGPKYLRNQLDNYMNTIIPNAGALIVRSSSCLSFSAWAAHSLFTMLQFAGTVLIVLALIALAGHSVLGSRSTWTIGQSVNTTSGIIIGHTAPNKTNISEYLGIPYAQAATGNLRFAPPVAYNNKALFNATKFVRTPLQTVLY